MIKSIASGMASFAKACTTHRSDWAPLVKTTGLNPVLCALSLPVFFCASMIHWLLWAADEVFFSDYKHVEIVRPVFITGIPRSGTTHLLRTLAQNRHHTSYCTTRDCVLGPTLSGQALVAQLRRIDQKLGKRISHALHRLLTPFQKSMSSIHAFSWDAAEEDFIWLWPLNACFLGVLISPNSSEYWNLANLDERISPARKQQILTYYKACIQKKLYGKEAKTTYLCKNPSFSLWIDSLREMFPDARWIFCHRDLNQAVASQLSSLEPALQRTGIPPQDPVLRDRFIRLLTQYEQKGQLRINESNGIWVTHDELKYDLEKTVLRLADSLNLKLSEGFVEILPELDALSSAYESGHEYIVSEDVGVEHKRRETMNSVDSEPI